MRVWLTDPETMCQHHIEKEDADIHYFYDAMLKGFSLEGYVLNGLYFGPSHLSHRHTQLADFYPCSYSIEIASIDKRNYPDIPITNDMILTSLTSLFVVCPNCGEQIVKAGVKPKEAQIA